jgi:quinoprotein dehydrogenase-associated probable ABC transporter substrate-binding protein
MSSASDEGAIGKSRRRPVPGLFERAGRTVLGAVLAVGACVCAETRTARALDVKASAAASAWTGPDVGASGEPSAGELRVCADPNNLPFSNLRGEGFENALAELVAGELGKTVTYTWFPQRRGFIRNTLRAKRCDVVMGVPTDLEMVETTTPYYRSSYVFVTRRARRLAIRSLDDPALQRLRIGLHVIGDDYNNVPPAASLALRGIFRNVRGYTIYGAYSEPDPPRRLIDAVANDEVDVAIAWGPLAGYFAKRERVPLRLDEVPPDTRPGALAMQFDISMGVRHGDEKRKAELERVLLRRQGSIRALLARFGVPLLVPQGSSALRRKVDPS